MDSEDQPLESIFLPGQNFAAAVVDTVAALVVVLNRQGSIVVFNRACEQSTGYAAAEVMNKPFWDIFIFADEMDGVQDQFQALLSGIFPSRYENDWRAKSGERRRIAWTNTALRGPAEDVQYVISTGIDITEQRRTEFAFQESEQRYRSLFKNNHAVMMLLEPKTGSIVDANPAACRFYGYELDQLRALKITDINQLSPEEVFAEMEQAKSEARNHFLFRHRLADGSVRDVEVYSGPIQVGGKELLYSIVHDITERRIAEQQRERHLGLLNTLVEVSSKILAERTLDGLWTQVLNAALSLTGAEYGWLIEQRFDGAGSVRVCRACDTSDEQARLLLNLAGRQTSVRLSLSQLKRLPSWHSLQSLGVDLHSLLGTEIAGNGETGSPCWILVGKEQGEFTAEEEALLVQLAALAFLSRQQIEARGLAERRADEMDGIISAMTDAVAFYDAQGQLLKVNPAAINTFGFDPFNVVAADVASRIRVCWPDGRPIAAEEMPAQRALQGETIRDTAFLFTNYSGEERFLLVSSSPVYVGNQLSGAVVVWHDVTNLRRVEKALRHSEARYRRLVESNIIGVIFANGEGEIREANDAFLNMVGYTREDLQQGKVRWNTMTPPEYNRVDQKALEEARQTGTCTPFEKEYYRKDGLRVPILAGFAELEDTPGEYICFILDLTERKKAQDALKLYARWLEQTNRDLQDFTFVSSHDLQEPLRKIQVFSDRMNTKYAYLLDDDGRLYLERMHSAAARMQDLITDLLTYSRLTKKGRPFVRVHLNEVMEGVLDDLEALIEQSGGQVEVGILPEIDADPSQVRLLFQHLVGNALKFRSPGVPPHVRITAVTLPSGNSEIPMQVQIAVEDNGIGFEEHHLNRIFQPFQRLHSRVMYPGTGIGLAICRKVVERHNGQITAHSKLGVGSTFLVNLPVHNQEREIIRPF